MSLPEYDIQISIDFESPHFPLDVRRSRKFLALQKALKDNPQELEALMSKIREALLR